MTNPDNAGGLLPCPFCGGAAVLSAGECGIRGMPLAWRNPKCTRCGCDFGYSPQLEAVERWNRRAELCRAAPAGGDAMAVKAHGYMQELEAAKTLLRQVFREVGDEMSVKLYDDIDSFFAKKDGAPAGGDEGLWQPTPCPTCNGFCGDSGPTCAEVRDAAHTGGEYRGVIPQALDETINGVVSDLEMIASGKDQVTGDPVSGLQSQRIAKSAHGRLLAAWNACESAPAGSGEVDDAEALREFTEYFVKNYPGPHTVIMDPNWHAPKIFRAAKRALLRKLQQGADERLFDALKRADALAVCCTAVDSYSRSELWDIAEAFRAQIRPLIASQDQEGGHAAVAVL